MRVLTFLHSFQPGGVERVALRLVRHWRSLGIDAPLFMGRNEGPLRQEVAIDLEFSSPQQPLFGSAWWETIWMIAALPGYVRRTKPDVIFCAGSTYTIVAVALKLILGRACPPIVTKISNDLRRTDLINPAQRAWRLWLKVQARFIDVWIIMEASIVSDVKALMGDVRYTVIPDPAIDGTRLPEAHGDTFGVTCAVQYLAVGRLAHQKDYPMMLQAFSAGARPSDTLTIFGDGPLRHRLREHAAGLGIDNRVFFKGHVSDAGSKMHEFDVLLLSSRYEGVPAVLIEALAAGLPIVATDCGPGVAALLSNGKLGYLIARGDVEAFAAALWNAPYRPVDKAACLSQARRFTIEDAAGRYLAAMEDVLRHRISPKCGDSIDSERRAA